MQGSQQSLTGSSVRIWLNHSFEIVLLTNSSVDGQAQYEEYDFQKKESQKNFLSEIEE